ncbi:MAG: plasmid pRiA4b ORF-3 family protein, partial [Alkalibacterium sp.]
SIMHIFATTKVLKAFKKAEKMSPEPIEQITFLEDEISPEKQGFFEWHINSVKVDQDDLLVLTHDQSGLTLLFLNVETEDLRDFYEWVEEALYDLLGKLGFTHQSIQNYIAFTGKPYLSIGKAVDRKKIGRNSSAVTIVRHLSDYKEDDYTVQSYWQYQVSRLNRSLKQEHRPFKQFITAYEKHIGPVSYKVDMAEIEIKLKMDDLPDIIRIVHMPMQLTFEDLHRVIQRVFMWEDAHLYQFIMEDGSTILDVKQMIQRDRYQMGGRAESHSSCHLKLSEVMTLEENGHFTYIYDFGDSWEHSVRVRKFYTEHKRMYPKLTMMSGDPVPENVGGPSGYAYFLDVINDPTHEEHSFIKEWSKEYVSNINVY